MATIDIALLKEKISESRLNISGLAKLTEMDASTFYRKIKSEGETFTVREVGLMIEALNLTKKDASAIFFNRQLADKRVMEQTKN